MELKSHYLNEKSRAKAFVSCQTGPNVIKLFFSRYARVFVPGRPLQPTLMFGGKTQSLPRVSTYKVLTLQGASRSYKELQGATRSYKELQGATRSYKELQGATRSYKELHGAARNNKELQGATRSYKELQ